MLVHVKTKEGSLLSMAMEPNEIGTKSPTSPVLHLDTTHPVTLDLLPDEILIQVLFNLVKSNVSNAHSQSFKIRMQSIECAQLNLATCIYLSNIASKQEFAQNIWRQNSLE
jgi:hypothetical protein